MAETRFSANNNLVLVRSDTNSLRLFEVNQPFLLKATKGFMEDAAQGLSKVPMMFVAVGAVAIYQLFLKQDAPFCRRKERASEDDLAH